MKIDGVWTQTAKLLGTSNSFLGSGVRLSRDGQILIAADGRNLVRVYQRSGNTYTQITTISNGPAVTDNFGYVIGISDDASVLLLTAQRDKTGPTAATNQGIGYIYVKDGSTYIQALAYRNPTGGANDLFGISGAVSADGRIVIMGEYKGYAYKFVRTEAGGWELERFYTTPTGPASNYGNSLDLSADGLTLVVGAPLASKGAISNAGAAYVEVEQPA